MFRRARLSVKPNVRPGVGARGSAAPHAPRGRESPRPPGPAAEPAPTPAEPAEVPAADSGAAEAREKAPGSSDENTCGENNVEESSKPSCTVSQRRNRMSATSSPVKPSVSVPPRSPPLSLANQETPQPNPIPAKEKQPCSDRYRIYKAQKLREMLKEELRKEKKQWKSKFTINESQRPLDRSKMTMRDFIYYLPDSNPMTSSLEQEKKTEKSTSAQTKERQENKNTQDADDNEEVEEEVDDGPLLVPRVKVAEDGSIILDEESLTVEVLRTKGPCVVEENDPIFERGSTTTYSSFRKNYYSKPWSNKETDMFFLAISMVGTDFSMIGQLFPHRARIEIKNKFKREEKTNGWRIDKAFQEKRPFDFDFFAHLLQKVLAEEEKRKQKSTKSQSIKEKVSKPRKNVKAKKVTSEGMNDDPDECVNASVSDTEQSQRAAQIVDEEEPLTCSEQDSGQVVLESDQNQKKRRRKNPDEANKQEIHAPVHSGSSEAEVDENQCQPEASEGECIKEQTLSFGQNVDDIVGLASSEKVELRTDPILSACDQQGAMPVAPEFSESSTSDLPSEAAAAALYEADDAESGSTEEKNVDPKSTSLDGIQLQDPTHTRETDQAEIVKLKLRGRLQRPKPNLSRAVGKKPIVSQDKTDGESKNSHSETLMEKNHMEKEKVNFSGSCGMEKTSRNLEAEPGSNLSEKTQQKDRQPKVVRSARLMRSRMQRPKPNVEQAVQEKITDNVEMSESGSFIDRDIMQQMENESCKESQGEDIILKSAQEDAFQSAQTDEPAVLNECLSIQEGDNVNKLKQTLVLRTRFQKPKPNIGRRIGRKGLLPKEDVPEESVMSGKMTSASTEPVLLDTSAKEKVPHVIAATTTTTVELESDFKKTKDDISSSKKLPETTDVTVEMEIGLETVEKEISPREMMLEMIDITMETETGLKASLNEVSSKEKVPELIDSTQEINTNLEETGRVVFSQENGCEDVNPVSEMEVGVEETGKEVPTRERTPDKIDVTEERKMDLEESERAEVSMLMEAPEDVRTVGEMEIRFKGTGEASQREKSPRDFGAVGEKENGLKDTGQGSVFTMEMVSGKMTAVEETNTDLKKTEREISILWGRGPEEIQVTEAVADLGKTGKIDISPREHQPEGHSILKQMEPNVAQSRGVCRATTSMDRKNTNSQVSVMPTSREEKEKHDQELSNHLSPVKMSAQNSVCDKPKGEETRPGVSEQLSDSNLSKCLPQEQKPLEVKPVPFVRSRFTRPKPNLARATLKRETKEAEKHIPGKRTETQELKTLGIQQNEEQNSPYSRRDVTSLMTSRENDKSAHDKEENVILPCIQAEKDSSPSNSCKRTKESQLTQNQENDIVVAMGTQKISIVPQETKQSVVQTALPARGRLQRPRPNVQKARQRQTVEKSDTEDIIKEEETVLQKEETKKKSLTVLNSQVENEIEVVSSRGSECRVNENQSHVAPVDSIHSNQNSDFKEERHENKPCPAQLIRRRFQKAKPNLERAHRKKEQPEGDSDNQRLKEKTEIQTSMEILARKGHADIKEYDLVKKDAQLKGALLGIIGEETIGDNSKSPVVEKQSSNKHTSHPQLSKESNYPKIAPHRRTAVSSGSECEIDQSGKRPHRKIRPNVTKGRGSKRIRGKTAKKERRTSKSMLVTLRASQKEDEDDAEDFESDYEEETYHLAPEELNKAPVFVPVGLRSPEPVSAQIEETMEELEITMDVADVGCVTVVEHQLSNAVALTQEAEQEQHLHTSFEMTTSEQIQGESDPHDGSTEAAVTLLTMGDTVLQSEISTEPANVGVCVFPDVHSKEQSHVPPSPDNVNHKMDHEYQELSTPVISISPASFEENKIVLKEHSTRKEAGLMKEAKKNTIPTRNIATTATKNLRKKSKPKSNPEEVLGTSGFDAHQEVSSLHVTTETEVEIQRETKKNDSRAVLEDKNFGPFPATAAESKEQNQLARAQDLKGPVILPEANVIQRNEDEEDRSQESQILSLAPIASSERGLHTLDLGSSLDESSLEEPLRENVEDNSKLTLHVPESTSTAIPEVPPENVIRPHDLTVNLVANIHQDGEDEQAFILTLVEIPANETEGFTNAALQLMPNSLLPAPILVKSGTAGERDDLSGTTSVAQDAIGLPNAGRDSEKPPVKLDLTSRKRFHCSPDESNHVPPMKKFSLIPRVDCQECVSEVYSKELSVFEERGDSCKGQGMFPISGSIPATPESQKEKIEPTFKDKGSDANDANDELREPLIEKKMTPLPEDEMTEPDKEAGTDPALHSGHTDSKASSSKPPLSRLGRRPLGFLSLICSKNSLDSEEMSQVHSKKRLKPHIPVSRRNLKRSDRLNESQKKCQESSDLLPSPSVSNAQTESAGNSVTQVSSDQSLLKEKCESGRKLASEEEAATVSEYFFGDIFIEVDETE